MALSCLRTYSINNKLRTKHLLKTQLRCAWRKRSPIRHAYQNCAMAMRKYHLACPYTSLPLCHCRLHTPAPPRHAQNPFKHPRAARETTARRALLLDIMLATRAPPGTPQTPCPSMIRAMHHRAAYGRLPPTRGRVALQQAALTALVDVHDEHEFVSAADRLNDARDDLSRAEQQLVDAKLLAEDETPDDHDPILHLHVAPSLDAHAPQPGHLLRNGGLVHTDVTHVHHQSDEAHAMASDHSLSDHGGTSASSRRRHRSRR